MNSFVRIHLDTKHEQDKLHPSDQNWQPPITALKMRALTGLLAIDLLCVVLGVSVASYVGDLRISEWVIACIVTGGIYTLVALFAQIYSQIHLTRAILSAMASFKAAVLSIFVLLFLFYTLKIGESYSRIATAAGIATTLVSLSALRYIFVRNLHAIIGGNPFSVLLLCEDMSMAPPGGYSVAMTMDGFDPRCDDPVMYDRFAKIVAGADRVVIACSPDRRAAWAHALKGANVDGEILTPELAPLAPLGMSAYHGRPAVVVAAGPLNLLDRCVKRVFDLTMAGAAVIMLSPLLGFIALAIKLDSAGPVLFRQTRIGRGNQMFQILKFRSMRVETSDSTGNRSASRDDDRITRVGRFLRRTSLDEVPQFFNILKGDMSIVGPRPHALGSRAAEKLFWEVDNRYWHRHNAKPGLTGLAQVRGHRGATVFETDLTNRLQADLEYLEHWSIWRDIHIIAMTVRVILHPNAY